MADEIESECADDVGADFSGFRHTRHLTHVSPLGSLQGRSEELRNRLNHNPEGLLRSVHEGPKSFKSPVNRWVAPPRKRRLKDRPVLFDERGGKRYPRAVMHDLHPLQQRVQARRKPRELLPPDYGGLPPMHSGSLQAPVPPLAEFDGERRLSFRVVGGGKEHVGIEKQFHFRRATASRMRVRSRSSSSSSASQLAICSSL